MDYLYTFVNFALHRCRKYRFKGTVARDFYFRYIFHDLAFPKPLSITVGPFRILSKIRGDIQLKVHHSGKWKKSSIIQILIILFGHLWK
jgi:hypothetical protein